MGVAKLLADEVGAVGRRRQEDKVGARMNMAGCGFGAPANKGQHQAKDGRKKHMQPP